MWTNSVKQKSIHKNASSIFDATTLVLLSYLPIIAFHAVIIERVCIQQATLQTHNLRVVTCRKKEFCMMMKTNVYLINKSSSLDTMMMAMCNSYMCWSQIVHDDGISFQNELKTKTQWRWWQLLYNCVHVMLFHLLFWGNVISYAG
mgnify:CR=1 FL=1